ncbi:MAG: NFACT family protein [Clostridia bacterium]|nr:NFACT family protein [Clostridia bacterium]
MPFDGIVTSNIVWELNTLLSNGRIEKIYQPEKDEIIIHIRSHASKYKLLISSSSHYPRIHITTETKSNPTSPPNFCMFLRKHLSGGKISSVSQVDFERIIQINVETFNELGDPSTKKLIVEIMGKHSNIILLDAASNKILDSIKKISSDVNRYRQILPGKTYVLPPGQDKVPPAHINQQSFIDKIKETSGPAIKSIYQSIQGFSPFIARQICELAGIDEDFPIPALSFENIEKLYDYFSQFNTIITSNSYEPCILTDEQGGIVDFYAFSTPWIDKYYNVQYSDSISEVIQAFYCSRDKQNRLKQKSSDLDKHIHGILDKLYKKKQKLMDELIQAEASDTYRLYGELINANIYRIQPGLKTIRLENYYQPGEWIEIPLDDQKSPSDNAQAYFKKYNKAKTAIKEKNHQLKETNKEATYFESVLQNIESASSSDDIEEIRQELIDEGYIRKRYSKKTKVKRSHSKPYEYTSSEGFLIMVGKNNHQNDDLTLKTASKNDIWMHTKEIPGSHVIILAQGKTVPEKTLFEAAGLAAYYSKGKLSDNVPVDYTFVKNVKKPNGAKPGMVIYDYYNTLYVNPKEPENLR